MTEVINQFLIANKLLCIDTNSHIVVASLEILLDKPCSNLPLTELVRKKYLVKTTTVSTFNHRTLVWMFHSGTFNS